MAASFSRIFAFSNIWLCAIHCRSKYLLIPITEEGNLSIPSKRMPTKACFWAIAYSSFQSASFKEEGSSDSEPMQNLKKSKKIFCRFSTLLLRHVPKEQGITDYISAPHTLWLLHQSIKPFQTMLLPP